MSQRSFSLILKWAVTLALLLPLLQTSISLGGCLLSADVLYQFDVDGTRRDCWEGVVVFLIYGGGVQAVWGFVLGSFAGFFSCLGWPDRRWCFLSLGFLGSFCFGWLVGSNWNFAANHCDLRDGCDATSRLIFDFSMIVFFGCPLLVGLGFLLIGIVMKDKPNPHLD